MTLYGWRNPDLPQSLPLWSWPLADGSGDVNVFAVTEAPTLPDYYAQRMPGATSVEVTDAGRVALVSVPGVEDLSTVDHDAYGTGFVE